MRYTGFIGPSYVLDSVNIDCQRCINLYPKLNEMSRGKSAEVASLYPTSGLRLLKNLGTGKIRGNYTATNGILYVVSGDEIYKVDSLWNQTLIGKMQTNSGPVSFSDNGFTLVIVDGPNLYKSKLGSLVSELVIDENWLGSNVVNFIDGYFIFSEPDTGKFYISGLYDVTFDPLDFASTDGTPDNIISTLVNHGEVWHFGTNSIEAWYNSGNADFPFERISGGFLEMGCVAAFSVAKINRMVLWLGSNKDGQGIVYAAQGFVPQRISTHAIELAIQSYGDISDARAWTYQENGHEFYVLNFTSANTTWVYDLTTKLWHERAYLFNGNYQRHRADCHTFAYGTHVVGDYENGNIYKLDSNYSTDNGQEIRRSRTAPHISESMKRIKHNSFQLEMETGLAVDGYDLSKEANIMLQYSDDGGHTWSNEKLRPIGKIGEKKTRVKWNRLGISRDRVYMVSYTDPVKTVFIGVEIDAVGLNN